MNKRLVWNFEIANSDIELPQFAPTSKDKFRWETRFFWPEQTIIILNGLDESFLALSTYEMKHRHDIYYLLPQQTYNIKLRRDKLLYKPLIAEQGSLQGFTKKINLNNLATDSLLPGLTVTTTVKDLLKQLQKKGQQVIVNKEALIYKLPTQPSLKLELARLTITNQVFFSVCIEGYSAKVVEAFSKHLLNEQISCDYVRFLNQTLSHD